MKINSILWKLSTRNLKPFTFFNFPLRTFTTHQNPQITSKTELKIPKLKSQDIYEKLNKEGKVKLYETTYYYSLEKVIVKGSYVMLLICCSVFYSYCPIFLKVMNMIFCVPLISIIWENYKNQTRFVVSMYLIENGQKVSILNHKNETEVFNVSDLKLAKDDDRVHQKEKLNHQTFLIFTVKTNKNIYHLFRGGVYLDENLVDRIIEGKNINQI